MDKEVKEKWLKALRSGEYAQGKGALCAKHPIEGIVHCCLGVLCEVQGAKRIKHMGQTMLEYNGHFSGGYPTPALQAGLANFAMAELVRMNDSGRYSFADIADHIEKNY